MRAHCRLSLSTRTTGQPQNRFASRPPQTGRKYELIPEMPSYVGSVVCIFSTTYFTCVLKSSFSQLSSIPHEASRGWHQPIRRSVGTDLRGTPAELVHLDSKSTNTFKQNIHIRTSLQTILKSCMFHSKTAHYVILHQRTKLYVFDPEPGAEPCAPFLFKTENEINSIVPHCNCYALFTTFFLKKN